MTFSHLRTARQGRSSFRSRWSVLSYFFVFYIGSGCVDSASTSTKQPVADTSLRDNGIDMLVETETDSNLLLIDAHLSDVGQDDVLVIDSAVDVAVIDAQVDANQSDEYTTADIDEIFQRGCGSCHNSTASPPLNNGVSAWINRGSGQSPLPLIVPGDHRRSYLYHKLADTHLQPPAKGRGTGMPMGRQLYSSEVLARMARWIDNL